MKFHAQLLKQGFSNSKEPLVREEILLLGQGIHSPPPHQYCSPGWGAGWGKAVAGTAQTQTFLCSAQAWVGHSSHFHFQGAAFLCDQLLFLSALLLGQLNAFDCLKGFTAAVKSQCNER